MPKKVTFPTQLEPDAKRAVEKLCAERGFPQVRFLSRLVTWLVNQDEVVQAWVLGLMSEEHLGLIADKLLEQAAAAEAERSAGTEAKDPFAKSRT